MFATSRPNNPNNPNNPYNPYFNSSVLLSHSFNRYLKLRLDQLRTDRLYTVFLNCTNCNVNDHLSIDLQAILEDVKSLGVTYDSRSRTSDYFERIMGYCEQLIRSGDAYVDDTEKDTMKKERNERLNSKSRDRCRVLFAL